MDLRLFVPWSQSNGTVYLTYKTQLARNGEESGAHFTLVVLERGVSWCSAIARALWCIVCVPCDLRAGMEKITDVMDSMPSRM